MRENRNDKKRWTQRDIGSQKGKNVVVTGTGGLGFETAIVLAGAGAHVIITGRNVSKGRKADHKIKSK